MLTASFARPVGLFDNWFNKLTAYLTAGDFCHSEFIFSFTAQRMKAFLELVGEDLTTWKKKLERYEEEGMFHICFFIVWGDTVSYRLLKRKHNNPYYKFPNENENALIEMNISDDQEFVVAQFLFDQMKKQYDTFGALTYYVPLRSRAVIYDKYFCSQLMVVSLQQIQKLKNINPSSITPNKLYQLLLVQ